MVKITLGSMTKAERKRARQLRQSRRTKRYGGKIYKLYKEASTSGSFTSIDSVEAERIKSRLRKLGYNVRIEYSVWGNTRIWVRRKR